MNERVVYLGIDPGLDGAVAAVFPDGRVELHSAPAVEAKRGRALVPERMAEIIRALKRQAEAEGAAVYATLENAEVTGRRQKVVTEERSPRQGFKIGVGFGLWQGVLAGCEVEWSVVRAQQWKPAFALIRQEKAVSRERAQELFPDYARELTRRRADFAEALLLAEYGRRRAGR